MSTIDFKTLAYVSLHRDDCLKLWRLYANVNTTLWGAFLSEWERFVSKHPSLYKEHRPVHETLYPIRDALLELGELP